MTAAGRAAVACLWVLAACGAAAAQSAGGGTPVSSGSGSASGACASANYSLAEAVDGSFNATSIDGSPATFCTLAGYVAAQTPVWLFVYDQAAAPNPAIDTPAARFYLPPQEPFSFTPSMQMQHGLAFAIAADPPTTPTPLNDGFPGVVGLNIGYHP